MEQKAKKTSEEVLFDFDQDFSVYSRNHSISLINRGQRTRRKHALRKRRRMSKRKALMARLRKLEHEIDCIVKYAKLKTDLFTRNNISGKKILDFRTNKLTS